MLNWKNIKERQPELFDKIIIILYEDGLNEYSEWHIGQYIESDDKSFYGVVVDFDETGQIIGINPEKVKYWSPLLEGGYQLPQDRGKSAPDVVLALHGI